ncbi:MAG: pentapeptide repeat-containing protein [Proteobacteria bacterium]|nr:pentapeptide repeat-containing protein [Pseudomonadota bacterium]
MAVPPQQFDWKRQRILLLDQDDQFRFWARGVFNRLGAAEVISTASGFDALHALERTDATIGMIDLEFKGMTAPEFIKELRSKRAQRLSDLPIILLVKTQDKKAIYEASLAGIEGVIVKPIAEKALLTRVVSTLLKPERIVLNSNFAGADRRELPRIKPEAPSPRATARPASKAPVSPTGVVLKQRSGTPKKTEAAPAGPIETPPVAEPIDPPKATPKPVAPTVMSKPAEPAAKPTPPEPRAAAKVVPPKAEPPDVVAEIVEPTAAERRAEDWNTELAPKPKKKKEKKGSRKPSLDIPGVVHAHALWLDTNGQKGEKARFEGADLSGADLAGLNLANANFRGANLSDSNCTGTQLMSAELRRANMSGARLSGADLSFAAMRHANLSLADLSGATLVGADLAGAQLAKTNFKQADLTRASLLGADLNNADLQEASGLTQSQVGKAYGTKSTKLPPGLKAGSPEEWSESL